MRSDHDREVPLVRRLLAPSFKEARHAAGWFLLAILPLWMGCAMCASPEDYTYAAYGGRWQRDDPVTGRVGSAFLPGGSMVISDLGEEGLVVVDGDSEDTSETDPTEAEEDEPEAENTEAPGEGEVRAPQEHATAEPPVGEESLTDVSAPSNANGVRRTRIRSVLK